MAKGVLYYIHNERRKETYLHPLERANPRQDLPTHAGRYGVSYGASRRPWP